MADLPNAPSSFRHEEVDEHGSRLWMIILGVVLVALLAGAGVWQFHKKMTPKDTEWPASVSGRAAGMGGERQSPDQVQSTAAPGVYVWSGFDGWHLWIVNGGAIHGLKGTITSDKDFGSGVAARKGSGTVTTSGHTITFDLPSQPGLVGVDFGPGFFAQRLDFVLTSGGKPVSKDLITIGSKTKAKAVPLSIVKVDKTGAATS